MTARRRGVPAGWLRELERIRGAYGPGTAARKRSLVHALARSHLGAAPQVHRLHETLVFLCAFPDDALVRRDCEAVLGRFAARGDLRRFRSALADTGIAGTDIRYRFFWFTARWLAERWPAQLHVDWPEFINQGELQGLLRILLPASESAAFDEIQLAPRAWLDALRGSAETDATFLIRRFAALPADAFTTEHLYERLDPPLVLRGATPQTAAARALPSRTTARAHGLPVVCRTRPFERTRPDLRRAIRVAPAGERAVPESKARAWIDLAREAMVTRSRDLDSFEHANPRDVRLVDCGGGLQFACIGLLPERRALLDAIYGYLTLQSGVPVGYVLASALFQSAYVAYNVFETFRGAEAAAAYARVLAMLRAQFGATSFAIDPYQLGHDNAEGRKSGAWWFYYKLGFRPQDVTVRGRARRELARLRADPGRRSSQATLQALSAAPLFLHTARERADIMGRLNLGRVSLHISAGLAARAGGHREAAVEQSLAEAGRLLEVRVPRPSDAARRLAWERWAPLALVLPGIQRWPASDRAALARVIDAKGGRRESDFVLAFDRHARLRHAIAALARTNPQPRNRR